MRSIVIYARVGPIASPLRTTWLAIEYANKAEGEMICMMKNIQMDVGVAHKLAGNRVG